MSNNMQSNQMQNTKRVHMSAPTYGRMGNANQLPPVSQRVQMPNYNRPMSGGPQQRPNGNGNNPNNRGTQGLTKKQVKQLTKARRKEKDHFYVMRKFPCFLIFIFCLIIFAVSAGGLLTAFISVPIIDQVTALYVQPDLTPMSERTDLGYNEDGEEIVYEEQTVYVTLADMMFGTLGGISPSLNMFKDEEGNSKAIYYDSTILALNEVPEDVEDSMLSIAKPLFKFGSLFLIVTLIISLIGMIISFIAISGKRIFKGFGVIGIIVILSSVVMLMCGLVGLGVSEGNPSVDEEGVVTSVLDFGNLVPYITSGFTQPPETIDEFEEPPLTTGAGIGMFALLGGGVLVLFLSIFARRKVPYSIFDK